MTTLETTPPVALIEAASDVFVPDFLIIGVQKAGTTALADMLGQHDRIFASNPKEPEFWHVWRNPGTRRLTHTVSDYATETYSDPENYSRLFAKAEPGQRTFEASVHYFASDQARTNIASLAKKPKVIVCLRDPAKRAYSGYWFARKVGDEALQSFEEALASEGARRAEGLSIIYGYRDNGFYADRIRAWRDTVGAENVMVLVFEEFIRNPEVLRAVYDFIGVPAPEEIILPMSNLSGTLSKEGMFLRRLVNRHNYGKKGLMSFVPHAIRLGVLQKIKKGMLKVAESTVTRNPPMTDEQHRKLLQEYAEDIAATSALVGRDLTQFWRAKTPA